MKNFKRQRTHEYRQFKTNHAYQLVGLAKRSQNWLRKLNWTCIKPWLSIKKTFQKSQKYSFSSFWRPFQNTRIGFPRVSDSEFRAASESIFRSQGGHREYGCVIVPQNLQTCRCKNREGCYSLAHFFLRKRIRSVDDQGGYRFKCHLEHLERGSHTSVITY